MWETACHRLEYALDVMLCMVAQYHAIRLQTDCIMAVLAPPVEVARLSVYALWP